MKKHLFIIFIALTTKASIAQNINSQIEIQPFFRFDIYPQFTNAVNSIARYKLNITGKNWGINTTYKTYMRSNFLAKVGFGFFKYSFNQIESTNRFGIGYRRIIDYPTSLGINLGTDKYWYNTFSLNLGLEKLFELKKDLHLATSINVKNHFTFSQQYHIPYDNSFIEEPELKIKNNYKTKNNRYFGVGGELQINLLKKIDKISIGPSLIIPIFDIWRQDKIFPTEINSNNRSKWFRGIGAGISCNYSLKKR